MNLSDFLIFYKRTVVGKVTFQQFKDAYKTFDHEVFFLDCMATNPTKLKNMTNQHGTTQQLADAITGKALHFWALSFHVMYRPEIETMKDAVDRIQNELTKEQFDDYIEGRRRMISHVQKVRQD